ncbi:IclR family transcriptional regulator domain-containing protein [Nocardia sp. R6R-6]|uniref:IclR family transcriptional regulator domain-containing protein n=1 Tax=Nocardia sp. R6R-6 TaxID=3459303 RepID=UPI00403D6020
MSLEDSRRTGSPVGTLDRAFLLLDTFRPEDRSLTLAELARRTDMPKPTVLRIARTLVGWRALERTDLGYRLGAQLAELGLIARSHHPLRDLALPFMSDLYGLTHGAVHLAVLAGTRTLILEKIASQSSVEIPSQPGSRGPAYCTALGKTLLAFSPAQTVDSVIAMGLVPQAPHTISRPTLLRAQLAGIRRTGIGFENEESRAGIACVAAPIFVGHDTVVGAISVAANTGAPQISQAGPAIRKLAATLSRVVTTSLADERKVV